MVRTFWMQSLVALVVVVCAASSLLSQEGRTPRAAYSSLVDWAPISQLVTQDEVLRDLKLTADQLESIRKAQAEYQQNMAANPPASRENFAEVMTKRLEAARKRDDTIRTLLGDKAKRLDQIAAQSAGLAGFVTRTELRQQLAITDEQLSQGKVILEAAYKEMLGTTGTPFVSSGGPGGAENRKTFVDKTTPKLLDLLTDEQKKRWQDATGEPLPATTLAQVRTSNSRGDDRNVTRGGSFRDRSGYSELVLLAPISLLVTQEEILRDLAITADQRESLGKVQAEYQQTVRANPPNSGQNFTEGWQKQQEAARKRDEAIRTVLGDKAKRLDQIGAQSAGLAAHFTWTALRQQLEITDEQFTKGRAILDETYKEMSGAEAGTGRSPRLTTAGSRGAEYRTAFADKTTPKLLELLSDDQKNRWQDAVGEAAPAATLAAIRTRTSFGFATFPDREGSRGIGGGDRGAGPGAAQSSAARLTASQRDFWEGRYSEAEDLARRALEGAKEPDQLRGDCLIALGSALCKLQRHPEAEEPLTEALALYEKLYGPFNPRIATAVGWLGNCAEHRGQLDEAEAYQRRALEINEKVEGSNSNAVAHNYNSLGNLAIRQKKLDQAEQYHRKALEIREKTLGKGHSLVALSLHNLGIVYWELGKPKEAEEHGLRAIELYRKTNPDHGELMLPLKMLTGLSIQQKRWNEAEKHAREGLRILEKGRIEGATMVVALDSLATILTATDRTDEAIAINQRKQVLQRKLSAKQLYEEGKVLEKGKDYPAAVMKMKEAIALAPDNHFYLAYASHVERLAGNYADGVEHALQAIKINEKVGWYHASVAFNAHAKGDLELARTYCKKAIDFGEEAVGKANFDSAKKLLDQLEGKK